MAQRNNISTVHKYNLLRYRYISNFHRSLNKFDKKKYIQPTNILRVYIDHFRTIVAETNSPSLIGLLQKSEIFAIFNCLIVSLTKQVSAPFLDAPIQQFTVAVAFIPSFSTQSLENLA